VCVSVGRLSSPVALQDSRTHLTEGLNQGVVIRMSHHCSPVLVCRGNDPGRRANLARYVPICPGRTTGSGRPGVTSGRTKDIQLHPLPILGHAINTVLVPVVLPTGSGVRLTPDAGAFEIKRRGDCRREVTGCVDPASLL